MGDESFSCHIGSFFLRRKGEGRADLLPKRVVDSGEGSGFGECGYLAEDPYFSEKLRLVLLKFLFLLLNVVLFDLGVLVLENGHGHVEQNEEADNDNNDGVNGVGKSLGLLDVHHDKSPPFVGDYLKDCQERPEKSVEIDQ